MKILWLYQYIEDYNYDHWLHMDFAKAIKNTEGIELLAYGLNLHEGYPKLATIPYRENLILSDIKKSFDFDVIIICTKDRMFKKYVPPYFSNEIREGSWLPRDFRFYNCPKLVLEEDYHYENNDEWYKEEGISLILQRHYGNVVRGNCRKTIKHLWLPFSVDTEVFKFNPDSTVKRINRICSASSQSETFYIHRTKVIKILEKKGMLINLGNQMKNQAYPQCLQDYISHLNGSGIAGISSAKMFEIMASGSLLFTNKSDKYGLVDLFPENAYCTYKEDYSNVISQAKMIINDEDYVKETVNNGVKVIKEKHTHQIRIKQLIEIIKKEFKL